MSASGVHRPRNVGWARAAAFLYGDWGTSKAYVIGLAFVAAGFSSFPIILAVCAFTGLVGYNYTIVCKHFPMEVEYILPHGTKVVYWQYWDHCCSWRIS